MALFRRQAGATSFHGKKEHRARRRWSLRAFLLQTVVRLTAAQGAKRQRSIMKPSLLRLLIFLLFSRRCLLGFFESHIRANRPVNAKIGVSFSSRRSIVQWRKRCCWQ